MSSGAEEPNTKHVSVSVPVPREPAAYRPSVHFGQRLRERVPERLRDRVVNECIETGECRGVRPPRRDDADDEIKQHFAFEATVADGRWRLVVGIRSAALLNDDKKHLAVTVMEVDDG